MGESLRKAAGEDGGQGGGASEGAVCGGWLRPGRSRRLCFGPPDVSGAELEFDGTRFLDPATGESVTLTDLGTASMCGSQEALQVTETHSSPRIAAAVHGRRGGDRAG